MSHLIPYQQECIDRLSKTVRQEQEAYISQHPEVAAMVNIFVTKMIKKNKSKHLLAEAANHFSRSTEDLEQEIRKYLDLPKEGAFTLKSHPFQYKDYDLEKDLYDIKSKHFPRSGPDMESSKSGSQPTLSSSFMSLVTSDTTLPTPEPIPIPDPTFEELVYDMVSNLVDKAIFLNVSEGMLKYDTAYVELMHAVERAMEIPVIGVREDIAELIFNAYTAFEEEIIRREIIEAEIAWERRMRKKQKKTLRNMRNFKGYQSPVSDRSSTSEDSIDVARFEPLPQCICYPENLYNRYPKDRFGIYLPTENEKQTRTSKTAVPCPYLMDQGDEEEGNEQETKHVGDQVENPA